MNWLLEPAKPLAEQFRTQAEARQSQLTKPPGSLGMLEQLAIRLSALQGRERPAVDKLQVCIFAADHGIATEGVSAFPQVVTQEMVKNFAAGGGAANVLARQLSAGFEVIDVGLLQAVAAPNVLQQRAGNGTRNFKSQPAMTADQLQIALTAGRQAVERAVARQAELFIAGEMGIANTASASALAAVILDCPVLDITGAGTGLNHQQIQHKARIIEAALQHHHAELHQPLEILRRLGGFEIAALTGAYIAAAQQGLPVMVDGFICSVAALLAHRINPACDAWWFYGHRSEEKGHKIVLAALSAQPILGLEMRLGEASGALMAVPILRLACHLHNEMATFAQAHITTG